jgi:hypothetical protein
MVEAQPCCQTVMAMLRRCRPNGSSQPSLTSSLRPNQVFTCYRNRRSARRFAEHGAFGRWQHSVHAPIEA